MKTNRIKNIRIHTVPITSERKTQIEYVLSRIYANYATKMLDDLALSNCQKANILKEIIKNRVHPKYCVNLHGGVE